MSAGEVRSMFDRIAPIYDVMNTLMTGGLDGRWRRAAARAAALSAGGSALDVACGSGALTRELATAVGSGGHVTGIDLSRRMIGRARDGASAATSARPEYLVADALAIPLPDASVDAATIAFGLRNVADYGACLREMVRVTRPGGRVVVLEIAMPESRLGRLLAVSWFERIVPILGSLAGSRVAYRYLPDSVRGYPEPRAVARLMRQAGLDRVAWRRLRPGLVTLHVGERSLP